MCARFRVFGFKTALNLCLSATLVACTYPDPQSEISFGAFAPRDDQLSLSTTMLPASLSIYHHFPQALDQSKAAQYSTLLKANRPFQSAESNAMGALPTNMSLNHDRLQPTSDNSTNIDLYDPFYLNGPNLPDNQVDSSCGGVRDGEPGTTLVIGGGPSGNGMCLYGTIKIALHNAVDRYDEFHRILVDILQNLKDSQSTKGIELQYTNPDVITSASTGVLIRLYYDNCVNHRNIATADPSAYAFCQTQPDSAVYHRTRIYPLAPTNTSVTTSSVIGKMEWLEFVDSAVYGKMSIDPALMTDTAAQTPGQMQFEFASDPNGKFKSFVIKHAPFSPGGSTEHTYGANVIRITRAGGSGQGIWLVEGSINYGLYLANPIPGALLEYGPGSHAYYERVYFVAVAEDVFFGGRTVYKAIMARNSGGSTLDYHVHNPADWDKQLHVWAAYKKVLKQQFTELHYLNGHGLNTPSILMWDMVKGTNITPSGGANATAQVNGTDISNDDTVLVASTATTLQIWRKTYDGYGGGHFVKTGTCQPFAGSSSTPTLSNPSINPTNKNQVLIGDNGLYWDSTLAKYVGTFEARIVDITNTTGDAGTCPVIGTPYSHYDTTIFRPVAMVDFAPSGTRFMTINNGTTMWVWDTNNSAAPITRSMATNYAINSAQFDSTGTRVLTSSSDNSSYVMDVATGNWLRLYNDEGNLADYPLRQTVAVNNPATGLTNQIITARQGGQNSVFDWGCFCYHYTTYPTRVYRWNISSWNPAGGNTTWTTSTSTSTTLVQTVDVDSGTSDYIYGGTINRAGSQLALNTYQGVTYYAVNNTTGAIATTALGKRYDTSGYNLLYSVYSTDGSKLYETKNVNYNSCYGCVSDYRGTIMAWDTTTFSSAKPFTTGGHSGTTNTAVYSSDGLNILSSGTDGTAIIWNADDGSVTKKFSGHTGSAVRAMFTHNQTRILTGSADNTARLWDATFGSPTYGTTLRTFSDATTPAAVRYVDYDNHFSQHRIAIASADGDVEIYNDAGTRLMRIAAAFGTNVAASWLDFSDDGRYLAVAGSSTSNNIRIYNTDPTSTYPSYTLVATLSPHVSWVTSVVFFPNDNTRLLTTSSGEYNSKVTVLTITPGALATDPPTITGTVEKTLSIPSTNAVVTPQLHGLVTGTQSSGSGCYGCPYISHWDLNPASATYGLQYGSTGGPTGTGYYYDQTAGQVQQRMIIYSGSSSPDGNVIIGASQGSIYNPAWVDFDSYFNQVDANGFRTHPDERDAVNYYYVSPIANTGTTDSCYVWDVAGRGCAVLCSSVGGCAGYAVTSQYTYTVTGTNVPGQFNSLVNQLNTHVSNNPSTSGYYLDQFVYQPLN